MSMNSLESKDENLLMRNHYLTRGYPIYSEFKT